jgi:hypothetical protein
VENYKNELVEGIKTFFIAPELSLMPEAFLPNFFLKGFEAYYVLDDKYLDIRSKIRVLFSLFPELILFFNTDRKLGDFEWPAYIRSLRMTYGNKARIGVLYSKQGSDEELRLAIEKVYLYDIGIYCGCIPIEYSKAKNLVRLVGVLTANEARGKRNSLRAICNEACEFNFVKDGRKFEGSIRDISINHFSCTFKGYDPGLPMYDRVSNIQLKLFGIICTVDGVLFTKRDMGGFLLYIFIFRNSRNKEGLDPDMMAKVNGFIREHFDRGIQAIVQKGFDEEREHAKRRAGREYGLDSSRASYA